MEYSSIQEGYSLGNADLLEHHPIAIYASRNLPLSVLNDAEKLISLLAKEKYVLAGGWQSRMEKRLLKVSLRFPTSRIIYFLARGIKFYNLPRELEELIAENRLLVLSNFESERRVSRYLVEKRDQWMQNYIDYYLFLYIDPGGKTTDLFERCLEEGKSTFLLDHPENTPFTKRATGVLNQYNFREVLQR